MDNNLAQPDPELDKFIATFKDAVDRKYNRLICRLVRQLTHPKREVETELGNLIADILALSAMSDVVLIGSGSIRVEQVGPVVTFGNLKEVYPYDSLLSRFKVTGEDLTKIFSHIMRPQNRIPGEGQCFQVNKGIQAVYNDSEQRLESLSINEKSVQADHQYTICVQDYHYKNSVTSLGIAAEELTKLSDPKVVTTSVQNVLEEHFSANQLLNSQIEGRLIYK